jgi:tRNA dimethylallyltransferase
VWETDHAGSVAEYAALAHAAIDAVLARGRTPVVCGGSGLYLRAALADMPLPPQVAASERERFEHLYDRGGAEAAHTALAAADPLAAAAVHRNDRRRVVRALELHAAGASLAPEHDRLWAADRRHETTLVGLDVPPALVAERITGRTQAMFAGGVADEVRAARRARAFSLTAERIHGLQDVTALLAGRIDQAEAERRLMVRTRRYAKRQRTWMRRLPGLVSVAGERDAADVAADIEAAL